MDYDYIKELHYITHIDNIPSIIADGILSHKRVSKQHRIVAKVDQLMTLCDKLESKLKYSRTAGESFVEAIVHKILFC